MDKIILHCDLNNFFASAALTRNPTLKQLPVAVCGDSEKRHGIILAKNNIAKGFGVKTAETIWEAKRKCPDLVMLKPDYELYEDFSLKARKIYMDYSDKVEPFGIDECWVDVSNPGFDFVKGEDIANEIRKRIKAELSLTVSVGVSFTKTFAKLGSDIKKPDAVTVISKENFKSIVWPLSVSELLMVGKKTEKALHSMGIFTIGDIASAKTAALEKKLGKNGLYLQQSARGEENSPVVSVNSRPKPKSISHSATSERDLVNIDEVYTAFLEFAENISQKLKSEELLAKSIGINATTNDFRVMQFQTPLEAPTDMAIIIANTAINLFEKNLNFDTPFRAVGIRAINLTQRDTPATQLSLFESVEDEKKRLLEDNVINIRNKFGKDSIKRASTINNKAKSSSPGFYKR